MVLVEQNKRFFHWTIGAPGSVDDARLLRRASLFQQICRGEKIPNKTIIGYYRRNSLKLYRRNSFTCHRR